MIWKQPESLYLAIVLFSSFAYYPVVSYHVHLIM